MAEPQTLSELLAAQGERKLKKLRHGIASEIDRLTLELELVDAALQRQHRARQPDFVISDPTTGKVVVGEMKVVRAGGGLSRDQLFAYVVEMGSEAVTAPEMQAFLAEKGIDKNVEAVRVGLTRLAKDGRLIREDGRFAVANGARVEAEDPLFRDPGLERRES